MLLQKKTICLSEMTIFGPYYFLVDFKLKKLLLLFISGRHFCVKPMRIKVSLIFVVYVLVGM